MSSNAIIVIATIKSKSTTTAAAAAATAAQQQQQNLQELAKLLYDKSLGNAFVVTHMIRQLETDGLIYYVEEDPPEESGASSTCGNTGNGWMFDQQQIVSYMEGGLNTVQHVVVNSLKSLDIKQQQLLTTAASFGVSYFELSVIVPALKAMDDDGDDSDMLHEEDEYSSHFQVRNSIASMESLLDVSIQKGFVERVVHRGGNNNNNLYKFSHDRIREAGKQR